MPDDAPAAALPTPAAIPGHVVLRPRPGRKWLGWSLIVLGVLGLVLPFLQGFLFLALGVFVLRDQYIWAADRWAWLAGKWPDAVGRVERMEASLSERMAGWAGRLRGAFRRG